MTWSKRLFDLGLAMILSLVLAPVLVVLLAVLWITQGRPLFYISERMKTPTQGFVLVKLRTMNAQPGDSGVTGGDKTSRMSRTHRLLRRSRFDEIPQLWNVLRSDMSFVGPRPPLRIYVADYPAVYGAVLQSRPGITGLASLRFHRHEEQLLAACRTAAQTDDVYRRRCIPRKARLDLLYQRNRSLCWDIALIWQTGAGALFGRKPRR